jgi:hypothetical protein
VSCNQLDPRSWLTAPIGLGRCRQAEQTNQRGRALVAPCSVVASFRVQHGVQLPNVAQQLGVLGRS